MMFFGEQMVELVSVLFIFFGNFAVVHLLAFRASNFFFENCLKIFIQDLYNELAKFVSQFNNEVENKIT